MFHQLHPWHPIRLIIHTACLPLEWVLDIYVPPPLLSRFINFIPIKLLFLPLLCLQLLILYLFKISLVSLIRQTGTEHQWLSHFNMLNPRNKSDMAADLSEGKVCHACHLSWSTRSLRIPYQHLLDHGTEGGESLQLSTAACTYF